MNNKVSSRCAKDSCAKFLFASNRMYSELKWIKIATYLLNIVPVVICFLSKEDEIIQLVCSLVSFTMTLITEVVTSFLNNYKEKAILEHQLYESEITGSSFSKIEYDRETTNDLNELAIRKGMAKMRKQKGEYPISYVPAEISDDHSYLYLCRTSASKYRFLLSRMFYLYGGILIAIAVAFISVTFTSYTGKSLYLLVCFWPLIIPFIRDCAACKKCIRQCVKICADIDNFFADGDASVERLARFYYYVQNIEFEMLTTRPVIYRFIEALFSHGVRVLTDGVTERFKEAIVELKEKSLINKGIISQPKGRGLITKVDHDLDYLKKIEKNKKNSSKKPVSSVKAGEQKPAEVKGTASKVEPAKASIKQADNRTIKPEVKTQSKTTASQATSKKTVTAPKKSVPVAKNAKKD